VSASLRPARFIIAAAVALMVAYAVIWAQISSVDLGRSDFTSFYVGGTLLREGHGASLYNEAIQEPLHSRLIAPDREPNLPFVNPPVAAAVVVPATLLSLSIAFRLWSILEVAVLLLAAIIAARSATWPLAFPRIWKAAAVAAATASMGTWTVLMQAQWTPVLALGIALAYRSWKRDQWAVGAMILVFAAGMAKPQLALGLIAFMLGWRRRRIILGALVGAAVLGVTCVVLVGPSGIGGFVGILATSTTRWDLRNMLSFVGVAGSILGNGVAAHVLGLVASAAACVAAGWLGTLVRRDISRLDAALVGATVLSLLASPHAYSDDLVMLAPAAVIGIAAAARHGLSGNRMHLGVSLALVFGAWSLISVAAFADFLDAASFPPGQLSGWVLLLAAVLAVVATRIPEVPRATSIFSHGARRASAHRSS
jgi:Glycosyltransferase family 87